MFLDALKELSLLLRHLLLPLTVQDVKHLVSYTGTAQPSKSRGRERHKSQCHERIKRDLRNNRFRNTRRENNSPCAAGEHSIGDREQELVPSALDSQLEEAVPVQRWESFAAGRSLSGFWLTLIRNAAGKRLVDRNGRREELLSELRAREA